MTRTQTSMLQKGSILIKKFLAALIGGAGLSALSLSENTEVATSVCDPSKIDENGGCSALVAEKEGFPFSFINDYEGQIGAGRDFIQNQFDLAPALANLIFWAIIAAIILKFLSWAFEKFSMLIFVGIVIALGASYFGLLQAV